MSRSIGGQSQCLVSRVCLASRAALLMALVVACGDGSRHPSVLLVTIDTLRADAVSAWGEVQGTTPYLDALAESGTRFADATTVTPLTLPAHASMLTGLRPARHGLTVNGVATEALPVPTLAEHLHASGFQTAAFVSAAVLGAEHGLAAGFDHYDDDLQEPGGSVVRHERRGDRTVDRALEWIGQQEDSEPWFAWVHLFDPHAPYAAPDGESEGGRAGYLDEVRWADRQLGRLLGGLGDRTTLVTVTSDHGESLGEHGEATHGVLMYQGAMHVPLVMAWSGAISAAQRADFPQPGVVREDVVSVLDVTPTILETLGLGSTSEISAAWEADGRSVAEPLAGRVLPLECRSPSFYYGFSVLAGVRQGSLKLVGAPQSAEVDWVLNDISLDFEEVSGQVVVGHPLIQQVLSTEPEVEAPVIADLDQLRALGYVSATLSDAGDARRDPRESMDLVDAIDAANTLLVVGEPLQAWERLEAVPGDYRDVAELHLFRGKALRALGRSAEAVQELEEAHALQPESSSILLEWGRALLEVAAVTNSDAALEGASAAFQQALQLVPGETEAVAMWSLAEIRQGRPEEALSRLDAALDLKPQAGNLLLLRWRALKALGREKEALDVAETIQKIAPELSSYIVPSR
jgi:choline-sulfatase